MLNNKIINQMKIKYILVSIICICVFVFSAQSVYAIKKRKPFEVEIESYDGFKLTGVMDIPDYASVETKAPLIIFLHSIYKNNEAWGEFPEDIKNFLNVATLNLDLRGHGKSTQGKKHLHWQNMEMTDYKKMPEDILEVLKFVEKEYPEINHKKIAVIGASLGATMGLMAASYVENIDTIIMFSPMLKYKGFDLRLPIVKYGEHPVLFIVSAQDKYSYDSANELIKFVQGEKKILAYPFGGHGEDLLKFQPESRRIVLNWLKKNFSDGKIIRTPQQEEEAKLRGFKYKKVGEYFGKIKKDRNIYRGVH